MNNRGAPILMVSSNLVYYHPGDPLGLNPAELGESTSKASRGYVRVAAALLNMPKSHVCLPTMTIISYYLK